LVSQSIDEALAQSEGTIAVIENTAGQGTNLGSTIEQLAAIYERCRTKERVGFCLDTCHLHAAGYDLSTVEGLERVLSRFDELLGLDTLRGMHLNDAKAEAGSHLDRHESLGEGTIGWACFDAISTDPRLCNIPLVLETVDREKWKAEVARIRGATHA
jgi:deoxyribonuclease-4